MIVIENQAAADNQIGEYSLKASLHGVVPVNVDMRKGHRLLDGHALLKKPLNQRYVSFCAVESKICKILLYPLVEIFLVSVVLIAIDPYGFALGDDPVTEMYIRRILIGRRWDH